MMKPYAENMYRKFCEFLSWVSEYRINDFIPIFREQLLLLGTIILDLDDNTRKIRGFIWRCSSCSNKKYIVDSDLNGCVNIFSHLNLQKLSPSTINQTGWIDFASMLNAYNEIYNFDLTEVGENIEYAYLIDEVSTCDYFNCAENEECVEDLGLIFRGGIMRCRICSKIVTSEHEVMINCDGEISSEYPYLVMKYNSPDFVIMHKLEHIMKRYKSKNIICKTRQKKLYAQAK